MTSHHLIAIGAAALTLGFSVATLATAAPRQGDYAYRVSPPSSNPHDVFRSVIKVPKATETAARKAECDCPMMKDDTAMRDMCMNMDRHGTAPKG